MLVYIDTTPLLTKIHHRADKIGRRQNGGFDKRLPNGIHMSYIGHFTRVVYLDSVPIARIYFVAYVGHGRNDIDIILPVQTLLYNLHLEHPHNNVPETISTLLRSLLIM